MTLDTIEERMNIGQQEGGSISSPPPDRISSFITSQNFAARVDTLFNPPPQGVESGLSGNSALGQLYDWYEGPEGSQTILKQCCSANPNQYLDPQTHAKEMQPFIMWLKDYLIAQHSKDFQYIFETDRGSTYFVLPTGENLRFKMSDPRYEEGAFGPIKRKVPSNEPPHLFIDHFRPRMKTFFISEEEKQQIQSSPSLSQLPETTVQTLPPALGRVPLQLAPAYKSVFKDGGWTGHYVDNTPQLNGSLTFSNQTISSFHTGTQISRMIRG
ncbi:MAG: hypothetical protein NTV98_02840 [Candidatus Roizmanbacteria bacterium]|nr:hypothetical protein [Candidatus Roizmanbacteria bacterium]